MYKDLQDHKDQIIEEEITETGITGNIPVFSYFLILFEIKCNLLTVFNV